MRRAGVVIFPLLLATALVVASLVAIRMNRPPDWQLELDEYVGYKDSLSSSSGTTTVQLVDRASRPWNFGRDMSQAVFGDSPYFQTDYNYGGRRGPRPLPFPPEDVRCVLLEQDHNEGTMYTIVFVAEHQDLYNADVVIHEGANDLSNQSFVDSISAIGCDLVLAQLRPSSVHR
jgi:hypothetical protein